MESFSGCSIQHYAKLTTESEDWPGWQVNLSWPLGICKEVLAAFFPLYPEFIKEILKPLVLVSCAVMDISSIYAMSAGINAPLMISKVGNETNELRFSTLKWKRKCAVFFPSLAKF